MSSRSPSGRNRITIALLALGGQGGGVLADWIVDVANANGFVAQRTSVPGVAQRTGSTVYYIEMVRRAQPDSDLPPPVLAMMPVPGDVDIVIASELMEVGRAILRGFVTDDRTTLIGSTHRVYAISEKSALGDGMAAGARILEAAERRAVKFIGFDMDAAALGAGAVISSVMLGALAGSGALPFSIEAFKEAIRHGGKAVTANLDGFAIGIAYAGQRAAAQEEVTALPESSTATGASLKDRIHRTLPQVAYRLAIEGVRRVLEYQDAEYARLYLQRLERIVAVDDGTDDYRLTKATARHLALWMTYEDIIRVADLKVRGSRFARIAKEVMVAKGQLLRFTEYLHPRLQEICEVLPEAIGRSILQSTRLRRWLEPAFAKGRHVETTSLRWFLMFRLLASMRVGRRATLRYREEQRRIESWLGLAVETARSEVSLAAEIIQAQELLKGYGDTFERGMRSFAKVTGAARSLLGQSGAADRMRALRTAALADETGEALDSKLACGGAATA